MHLAGQADAPRPSPPVRARTRAAPLPCSASSRRTENVPGEWFVDSRCIDCDACRSLAPSTFTRVAGQSAVTLQPAAVGPERLAALQALLVCPTTSIHTATLPEDVQLAHSSFPVTLHHCDVGVLACVCKATATASRSRGAWIEEDLSGPQASMDRRKPPVVDLSGNRPPDFCKRAQQFAAYLASHAAARGTETTWLTRRSGLPTLAHLASCMARMLGRASSTRSTATGPGLCAPMARPCLLPASMQTASW